MVLNYGSYFVSFLAGILSILSPCVLPLIPIIVGTALNTHRFGPYVLALGLAISFTLVGVFIATIGVSLGLDEKVFRHLAAVLLILFGAVLVSGNLQVKFASMTAGLGSAGQNVLNGFSADSLIGQFLLGALLGMVWSPCVGPILGATITLASQGEQLSHVWMVMAMFGLGAAVPLVVLGLLSRQAMQKMKGQLFTIGKLGKQLLGVIMLLIGLLIITGFDKSIESTLVKISPEWLVSLATKY